MFKKILLIVIAIVAIFCVFAATQPDDFRVERSATMNVTPKAAFDQVNNLHNWENWSPWAKLDPNAKMTYEGPDAGVGAKTSWDGDHNVGTGSMTITESKPDELVKIQLDFLKPFKSTNTAEFTFKAEGKETTVTWAMYGKNNFMGKAMGLLMNCEKMMAEYFDKGLANMKALVEAKPEVKAKK